MSEKARENFERFVSNRGVALNYMGDGQYGFGVQLAWEAYQDAYESLQSELAAVRQELETTRSHLQTEQARVAACKTVAIGFIDNCHEEFRTPAFDFVVKLRRELEEAKRDAERQTLPANVIHWANVALRERPPHLVQDWMQAAINVCEAVADKQSTQEESKNASHRNRSGH